MLAAGQTLVLRGSTCLFHIVLRVGGSLFCRMVLRPTVLLPGDAPLFYTSELVVEARKLILLVELEIYVGDYSSYPTVVVEGAGSRSGVVAGLLGS